MVINRAIAQPFGPVTAPSPWKWFAQLRIMARSNARIAVRESSDGSHVAAEKLFLGHHTYHEKKSLANKEKCSHISTKSKVFSSACCYCCDVAFLRTARRRTIKEGWTCKTGFFARRRFINVYSSYFGDRTIILVQLYKPGRTWCECDQNFRWRNCKKKQFIFAQKLGDCIF